jgi:hypothetical protein
MDKQSMLTFGRMFWMAFWCIIFFPLAIIYLCVIMSNHSKSTVKAELKDGTVVVYEYVNTKVIEALQLNEEF